MATTLPTVMETTRLGFSLGMQAQKFLDTSIKNIDNAVTKLATMQANPEVAAKLKFQSTWSQLKLFFVCTLAYATIMRSLCGHAEDLRKNYDKIKNGNMDILKQFLNILKSSYDEVSKTKAEWRNKLDCVHKLIGSATETCTLEIRKASVRKTVTRAVGGALATGVTVGGVGTGVTLSIVAGVFTFGIGTVVGLGVTAAGAAAGGPVIGAITAGATHLIARDFKKLEEKLRRVNSNIENMNFCADGIETALLNLNALMDAIKKHLTVIDKACDANYEHEPLFSALDGLLFHFKDLNLEIMDSKRKELENKINVKISIPYKNNL